MQRGLRGPANRKVRLSVDGHAETVDLEETGIQNPSQRNWRKQGVWIQKGESLSHYFAAEPRAEGGQASAADGAIIAPMPGKVIAVDVSEGQAVSAGSQVQVEAVLCRVVPAAEG